MSLFRRKATPPPPLRRDQVLVTGRAAEDLERDARISIAADILETALADAPQRTSTTGVREHFENACLDALSALRPHGGGSRLIPAPSRPAPAPLPSRTRWTPP